MVINDLIPGVIAKLRGRDDQTPRIPIVAKQAILDLTENYEFEELKVIGPLSNFIQGQERYPLRGYDPNGVQGNPFIQDSDASLTFIRSWFIYFDTTGVIVPGQSTGVIMKGRRQRVVEPMSKILGIPSRYCIVGKKSSGIILVGNMPNYPYACQMTYQRQHPFPGTAKIVSAGVVQSGLTQQQIFMPDDWQDIVEYATAEKICYEIGMGSVGQQYHQLLFGYVNPKGDDVPGIIMQRMSQAQRMTSENERSVKIVMRAY